MLRVLLLAGLLGLVYSHTCLIYPLQRGGIKGGDLATPGADDCGRTKGPCGEMYRGMISGNYTVGKQGSVTFQKNLDHYYEQNPGYFQVMIGDSDSSFYKVLATVKDSLDIKTYTTTFTVPQEGKVLQLQYVTNNPEAPPTFYQCADISIVR